MKKYRKNFGITTLLIAGLTVGLHSEQMVDFVQEIHQNEMIQKLKKLFENYVSSLPEERIYVHTDKSFYYPGETIWFAVYVRNGEDLKASCLSEIVYAEWISPKGTIEKKLALLTTDGVAQGDIFLDQDAPGGIYTLKVYTNWQQNDPKNVEKPYVFQKEVQVQRLILPNLLMKLDFEKESYTSADNVKAFLSFRTLEDKPLTKANLSCYVFIEGNLWRELALTTDENGKAVVSFQLPENLATADVLLNAIISYQGNKESIARSVPVVLNRMTVEFFPEGGDLVAGFMQKVAFRLLNEWKKPADGEGILFDDIGREILHFASYHQGMGAFEFIPQPGRKYKAKLIKPAVNQVFELPEVLERGFSIQVSQDTALITVRINSTEREEVGIIGQMRGKIYYTNAIKLNGKPSVFTIPTQDLPCGVMQITLFDAKNIPRAERLVFVNRDKQLNIQIQTDKTSYRPREKVTMTVSVADERGLPVPANLSLSVVNDKILSFADDKQGNILAKLLLEPDISGEVFEPNFYFDKKEPKSLKALDYLMLTQGWRRFTWEKIIQQKPIQITYQPEKQLITGKVVDIHGKGIAGVKVESDSPKISTITDKDGNYSFSGILLYKPLYLKANHKDLSGELIVYSYGVQSNMVLREFYRLMPAYMYKMNQRENFEMAAPLKAKKFHKRPEEDIAIDSEKFISETQSEPNENIKEIPHQIFDNRIKDKLENQGFRREAIPELFQEEEQQEEVMYYRARQFAAPIYENKKVDKRTDFRQTIYWNGNLTFDRKGKAEIVFYNSDEVTTFRVIAEGIGIEGSVGRAEITYATSLPFSISAKMPTELLFGDKLEIPVVLLNNTTKNIEGELQVWVPASFLLEGSLENKNKFYTKPVNVPANNAITVKIPCKMGNVVGEDTLIIKFLGNQVEDALVQPIKVVPRGFPASLSVSGKEISQKFSFDIVNPVSGSIRAKVTVYPTSLADLLAGIESILSEPYGCFEQVSSATYPNIMVLRYLQESDIQNPRARADALAKIETGYKKLIAFETPEKGYEWFGGVPAHEALTAYGILEFTDMKQVYSGVDENMIKRTIEWLLSRKDGKGGFLRDSKALDNFGRADSDVTNAYIVWALSEAGYLQEIAQELENSYRIAIQTNDDYICGLIANALFNVKDARAESFLKKWVQAQQKDGSFSRAKHSITRTTGKALAVETTSLAVLAMLKSTEIQHSRVEQAIRFIVSARTPNGGFGNTQTTIMALKALTVFAKYARRTTESGDIEFYLDEKLVQKRHFEANEKEAIVLEGIEKHLLKGKYKAEIRFANCKNPLPYTFALTYHSELPVSSSECKVSLQTVLSQKAVKVGESVRLSVFLQNKLKEGLPMTVAIVGFPAGTSVQPWQLKELQHQKTIDFYEIVGNNVILYFRQFFPEEKRTVHLDLKAEVPGNYTAAASTAYLYYTTEHKTWSPGVSILID